MLSFVFDNGLTIKFGIKDVIQIMLGKAFIKYMRSISGEPLFWIILIVFVGLVIFGIFATILEKQRKKNEQKTKKVICPDCKGYGGEIVTNEKGLKERIVCPHCSGTGWAVGG